MTRPKDETLFIRTSADINQLLGLASEKAPRSFASMTNVLILNYAQAHDLKADAVQENPPKK